MPFLIIRLMRTLLLRRRPLLPLVIAVFVFLTSWPLMWWAEPAGSALVRPANYYWWFIVACTTVGFGDYTPTTAAGHLVGLYVIVGGIATLTTIFTQMSLFLDHAKGKRMSGAAATEYSGHIVVVGYTPGRTERIVAELLADGSHPVVLCAWHDVDAHPMPDRPVDFVRGDITDCEVLGRAGLERAFCALVDARDDNEALAVTVSIGHLAPEVRVVAAVRDLARATHLRYVVPHVRCVQWHHPRMLTEELLVPGVADVYIELMTHGGGNTYSLDLPETLAPAPFGDWQNALGRCCDATAIAIRTPDALTVGPSWDAPVPGGAVIYYVCRERLRPEVAIEALRTGTDQRTATA